MGGSRFHGHFEDVFDIVAAELRPRPLAQIIKTAFWPRHGVDPRRPRCRWTCAQSRGPHALGHDPVLVVPERVARGC